MKGSMIALLAMTALAPQVWASKARVNALQNSPTINDERDILTNPARAMEHDSFFVIEAGEGKTVTTAAGESLDYVPYSDPKAEGGFSRNLNDEARMGAHIGRHYRVTDDRNSVNATGTPALTFMGVKNPLDIYYARKMGEGSIGASLSYSKSDEKTAGKQDLIGVNLGYATSLFDVALNTLVTNSAENDADGKLTGAMPILLTGRYIMDTLYFTAEIDMRSYKYESAAGAAVLNRKYSDIRLGAFKRQDLEGGQFFYGGKINMEEFDDSETAADDKSSSQYLNVLAGLEANATSWLDLRGSVSQEVLYGTTKANGGDAMTRDNSTVVAAGASLKFGKLEVDASLGAALDSGNYGKVNGNSLLGDLAMTYNF